MVTAISRSCSACSLAQLLKSSRRPLRDAIDPTSREYRSCRILPRLAALLGEDSAAFSRDTFADTLFSYHLLFEMRATPDLAKTLRSPLKHFDHLTIENEVSLLEDMHPSVVAALLGIRKPKEIDLLTTALSRICSPITLREFDILHVPPLSADQPTEEAGSFLGLFGRCGRRGRDRRRFLDGWP